MKIAQKDIDPIRPPGLQYSNHNRKSKNWPSQDEAEAGAEEETEEEDEEEEEEEEEDEDEEEEETIETKKGNKQTAPRAGWAIQLHM